MSNYYNHSRNFSWSENDKKILGPFLAKGWKQQNQILEDIKPKKKDTFAYQKVFDRLKNNPKYAIKHVFDFNKNNGRNSPTYYFSQEAQELIAQEINRLDSLS